MSAAYRGLRTNDSFFKLVVHHASSGCTFIIVFLTEVKGIIHTEWAALDDLEEEPGKNLEDCKNKLTCPVPSPFKFVQVSVENLERHVKETQTVYIEPLHKSQTPSTGQRNPLNNEQPVLPTEFSELPEFKSFTVAGRSSDKGTNAVSSQTLLSVLTRPNTTSNVSLQFSMELLSVQNASKVDALQKENASSFVFASDKIKQFGGILKNVVLPQVLAQIHCTNASKNEKAEADNCTLIEAHAYVQLTHKLSPFHVLQLNSVLTTNFSSVTQFLKDIPVMSSKFQSTHIPIYFQEEAINIPEVVEQVNIYNLSATPDVPKLENTTASPTTPRLKPVNININSSRSLNANISVGEQPTAEADLQKENQAASEIGTNITKDNISISTKLPIETKIEEIKIMDTSAENTTEQDNHETLDFKKENQQTTLKLEKTETHVQEFPAANTTQPKTNETKIIEGNKGNLKLHLRQGMQTCKKHPHVQKPKLAVVSSGIQKMRNTNRKDSPGSTDTVTIGRTKESLKIDLQKEGKCPKMARPNSKRVTEKAMQRSKQVRTLTTETTKIKPQTNGKKTLESEMHTVKQVYPGGSTAHSVRSTHKARVQEKLVTEMMPKEEMKSKIIANLQNEEEPKKQQIIEKKTETYQIVSNSENGEGLVEKQVLQTGEAHEGDKRLVNYEEPGQKENVVPPNRKVFKVKTLKPAIKKTPAFARIIQDTSERSKQAVKPDVHEKKQITQNLLDLTVVLDNHHEKLENKIQPKKVLDSNRTDLPKARKSKILEMHIVKKATLVVPSEPPLKPSTEEPLSTAFKQTISIQKYRHKRSAQEVPHSLKARTVEPSIAFGDQPVCNFKPCLNHGTCIPYPKSNLGFICLCTSTYIGDFCQKLLTDLKNHSPPAVTVGAIIIVLLLVAIGLAVYFLYNKERDYYHVLKGLIEKGHILLDNTFKPFQPVSQYHLVEQMQETTTTTNKQDGSTLKSMFSIKRDVDTYSINQKSEASSYSSLKTDDIRYKKSSVYLPKTSTRADTKASSIRSQKSSIRGKTDPKVHASEIYRFNQAKPCNLSGRNKTTKFEVMEEHKSRGCPDIKTHYSTFCTSDQDENLALRSQESSHTTIWSKQNDSKTNPIYFSRRTTCVQSSPKPLPNKALMDVMHNYFVNINDIETLKVSSDELNSNESLHRRENEKLLTEISSQAMKSSLSGLLNFDRAKKATFSSLKSLSEQSSKYRATPSTVLDSVHSCKTCTPVSNSPHPIIIPKSQIDFDDPRVVSMLADLSERGHVREQGDVLVFSRNSATRILCGQQSDMDTDTDTNTED
ncbi:uncharacterized protein LOC102366583 isoform X2 [Latimeria chalumnae]|uniref:uncharacterized protein LOC102366583 isoform X2 n=1 Tax=Latimeria chalumnae TaxID=7897 RepID=UPI0003C14EA2|nr:PREDICTED: uncharacterized protein LOC102366583 isoform X2 [Latimeria chalumnae]XP_006012070.1 PREDICTED: uncharacterized protein LOC102366583 isoform X2 [Latimeria chalumnae]XP_014353815.1 PREDICTED: uncharacterized protein LOC102366583 isoform X2 [Latimeria chalumnae]|eukprot:XP_006012069.1 PREDICTED: uncharacterized protein LOC102366583 isoform X2 [Latimeria chalumnae]